MSNTLNKVMLIGRLGNDVQMHTFEDGNSIANVSLATSDSYLSKENKELIEHTEWHRIVFKSKLAEIAEKHLSKGDLIYVEGKLHTRSWEEHGNIRYTTEIVGLSINFLQSKSKPLEQAK